MSGRIFKAPDTLSGRLKSLIPALVAMMQYFGYNKRFVVKSALDAYDNMVVRDETGKSLYTGRVEWR